MQIPSKLPNVGTTIFTVMSALAHQHQAVNLSQGYPNYSSPKSLLDRVNYYMQNHYNQYAPMAGLPALRQRLADKANGIYGCSLDPESEITITAGATQAIFTAIAALVGIGDEVILLEPAYDSYRPSVEVMGGIPRVLELEAPEYKVDWEALQQLINDRTRLIIINTPHNPTGTAWEEADMRRLAALLDGTNIFLLSDEVYEHLIYDGRRHESVLWHPDLYQRSILTYSFGKTFHNTGWKMGYAIAPPALTREFRKVHQFNVFCVNSPIQYALADFLEDPQEYLQLPDFYQRKRDFFLETMGACRLKPLSNAGTYFQLFDYSHLSDEADTDFACRLTTEFGVAAIPVSVFYSSKRDDKVIRLCFAKTEDVLEKAGKLLQRV